MPKRFCRVKDHAEQQRKGANGIKRMIAGSGARGLVAF